MEEWSDEEEGWKDGGLQERSDGDMKRRRDREIMVWWGKKWTDGEIER